MLRAGDERAFEVMFDRHHRGILSFCRHMVSSREEAEDAVQHTFAAAYRDLVDSDKPIQLKAWLYTIARDRCLSILRARKEQVSIEDAEPATEGLRPRSSAGRTCATCSPTSRGFPRTSARRSCWPSSERSPTTRSV